MFINVKNVTYDKVFVTYDKVFVLKCYIMYNLLNHVSGTLGMCPIPLQPVKRVPDPISLGAAGITALGGIANSILGGIFGSSANSQNVAMQREINAQNYKMFKEQQQWSEDMWNKQNAYNDPSAQVQRLLAAGINPSAVFGSGSVSEAGALTSPNVPQMQSAHVNPYQPDLKVGDAVNAFVQSELANSQRRKMDAETKHTEQLNLFEQKSMDSRLRSLQSLAKRDDSLGEMARSELQYMQDSYYWRLKSLRNDIVSQEDQHRLSQEQIYNHRLQNGLAEVQLAYAPRLSEAQLKQYYATVSQIKAQIGLINANVSLTQEQRLHEIEKKTGTIIDNGLKGFDFKLKDATKKYVLQNASNNASILQHESDNWVSGERFRRFSSIIPFASGYSIRKYAVP